MGCWCSFTDEVDRASVCDPGLEEPLGAGPGFCVSVLKATLAWEKLSTGGAGRQRGATRGRCSHMWTFTESPQTAQRSPGGHQAHCCSFRGVEYCVHDTKTQRLALLNLTHCISLNAQSGWILKQCLLLEQIILCPIFFIHLNFLAVKYFLGS